MKKYRLIEYDPKQLQKIWPCDVYNSKEEVFAAMIKEQEENCFYRIEEFEESIMDKVKSYEDACKILGMEVLTDEFKWLSWESHGFEYALDEVDSKHFIVLHKLETITAALNEGWKPDWEDAEQVRYGVNAIKIDGTWKLCADKYNPLYANLPSRLYFKSRELAEYAAKQFADLYKQLLIENFEI